MGPFIDDQALFMLPERPRGPLAHVPDRLDAERALLRALAANPARVTGVLAEHGFVVSPAWFTGPRVEIARLVLPAVETGTPIAEGDLRRASEGLGAQELLACEEVLLLDPEWCSQFGRVAQLAGRLAYHSVMGPNEPPPDPAFPVVAADRVEEKEIEWFWEGRIPAGKLVCLNGAGSIGKTTTLLDLMARASRGKPMPGVKLTRPPMSSIILSAEEDESILRRRLRVAGADLGRIGVVGALGAQSVRLPTSIPAIRTQVDRYKAKLLVIDPFSSFAGEGYSVNSPKVRALMEMLVALAENTGVARVVLKADAAAGSPSLRRLSVVKGNYSGPVPPLEYELESAGDDLARVRWIEPGGVVDHVPEPAPQEVFTATRAPRVLERAMVFLLCELASGPLPASTVYERALAKRFSQKNEIGRAHV